NICFPWKLRTQGNKSPSQVPLRAARPEKVLPSPGCRALSLSSRLLYQCRRHAGPGVASREFYYGFTEDSDNVGYRSKDVRAPKRITCSSESPAPLPGADLRSQ
ncbi:hypothetical protein LEMLEM_LOCUS26175, partial [Lemmus lemmus]